MGKLVAYLGPATPVANVVEGGSYSLVRQASDYPDGFGIGWYPADHRPDPVRVTGSGSITSAGQSLSVPRRYPSHCIVAAVRKHADSMGDANGPQPYEAGPLLFGQVGHLDRFDEVYRRPLTQRLSDAVFRSLHGLSPEELLFANFIDFLADGRGHDAVAGALETLVGVVSDIGVEAEAAATLAFVIADGNGLVTLRTATQGPPPPLYTIVADSSAPVPNTGRVVASEPLFPGSWSALDPHALIIFTADPDAAADGSKAGTGSLLASPSVDGLA